GGAAAAVRLVSCLPAVTGDYGRLGGGTAYSTGRFYGFDDAAHQRPDLRPAGPGRGLVMSRLGRELLTRSDPPVQVLVVWAGNPVVSNPDQRTKRAGLSR
ncbi:MAG: molybdopterin oxidoreductase family protein, partial [Actinobacteria bacterium]|nr:molybdopterin oxidoreductase family protein [Actinomycetota bacterium]